MSASRIASRNSAGPSKSWIRVRTLPTVFELLRGGVQLNKQLREVRVEDVLGRDPIVRELDRVAAYLRDRIVLVTGAGGSIGSELCRQIAQVRPRLLVMLDHAEDNLFQIDREMVEERHFTNVEAVLADCKEPGRMLETMQRFKPSVVFHAAAYKHVPLMEVNPLEAVRNTRKIRKADMIHNNAQPNIEVDPETYEVRADGELLTCAPAEVLPMAQRYFMF